MTSGQIEFTLVVNSDDDRIRERCHGLIGGLKYFLIIRLQLWKKREKECNCDFNKMKYYVNKSAKWFIIILLTLLVLRAMMGVRQFLLQEDNR